MSLDFSLYIKNKEVFAINITHNLNTMAKALGIYYLLWRPEEIGIRKAKYLIPMLKDSVINMREYKDFYIKFNPVNGWGNYEYFLESLISVYNACISFPEAEIKVDR